MNSEFGVGMVDKGEVGFGGLKVFWGFWIGVQSGRICGGAYHLDSLNFNVEFGYCRRWRWNGG